MQRSSYVSQGCLSGQSMYLIASASTHADKGVAADDGWNTVQVALPPLCAAAEQELAKEGAARV
jgi:hypothetical protein